MLGSTREASRPTHYIVRTSVPICHSPLARVSFPVFRDLAIPSPSPGMHPRHWVIICVPSAGWICSSYAYFHPSGEACVVFLQIHKSLASQSILLTLFPFIGFRTSTRQVLSPSTVSIQPTTNIFLSVARVSTWLEQLPYNPFLRPQNAPAATTSAEHYAMNFS